MDWTKNLKIRNQMMSFSIHTFRVSILLHENVFYLWHVRFLISFGVNNLLDRKRKNLLIWWKCTAIHGHCPHDLERVLLGEAVKIVNWKNATTYFYFVRYDRWPFGKYKYKRNKMSIQNIFLHFTFLLSSTHTWFIIRQSIGKEWWVCWGGGGRGGVCVLELCLSVCLFVVVQSGWGRDSFSQWYQPKQQQQQNKSLVEIKKSTIRN